MNKKLYIEIEHDNETCDTIYLYKSNASEINEYDEKCLKKAWKHYCKENKNITIFAYIELGNITVELSNSWMMEQEEHEEELGIY